jgi:hypothetical protein
MRRCRQPASRTCISRGRQTVLCVLTALLAVAAAPPEKAEDGPAGGLFQPEIKPEYVAILTTGASLAPHTGPFSALTDLYAGTTPEMPVWSLSGPFTTKPGRIQVGASSLVLGGFHPVASPLVELAFLQAGEDRDCWALINTEEVRPFPNLLLQPGRIRDRHGLFNGDPEIEDYAEVLALAHFTSAAAFTRAARHDVTYAHLFNEPEHYRGQVIHITGRLVKVARFDPPPEARGRGVSDLYEAWIMTDAYGENPACIAFTDLPPGLKVDAARKYNIDVRFDGYFYKRYRYKAYDSKKANEFRDAPLLIGHTLDGKFGPGAEDETASESWGQNLIWVFLSVVGGALLGVVALTCWFRYHDRRIRHRLQATRHTEFVPPTEESFTN